MYTFKKVVGHTHFMNDQLKAELRKDNDHFVIIIADRITDAVIAEYHIGEIRNDKGEDRFAIVNAKRGRTVGLYISFEETLDALNRALFKGKNRYYRFDIDEFVMTF